LKELRNTTKNSDQILGIVAEISTWSLSNTSVTFGLYKDIALLDMLNYLWHLTDNYTV